MEKTLIDLGRQELATLKEFLEALQTEREAILSFSTEGIVRENNRKEEILKRLEHLGLEKERVLASLPDRTGLAEDEAWVSLNRMTEETIKATRAALERNKGLLSFSMDHVKSSIDKIIGFVNQASYDKGYDNKGRSISVMVSRKV